MSQDEMSAAEVESIMSDLESPRNDPANALPTVPPAVGEELQRTNPLELKEFVNYDDLKRDVEINLQDLDTDISEHAGKFVYYANQARLARRQRDRMKAAFEIMESRLDHIHRTALKADGGKATEAQIQSAVKADRRWWAANMRLIDAEAVYNLANDARSALEQRKDMLVQISVDRRTERAGQVRVMEAEGAQRFANTAASLGREAALAAEARRKAA